MAILTAKDAKIIGESITSPLQTIIPVKSLEEATIIAKQELALDKQGIKQEKDLLDVMKSLKDSIDDLSQSVKEGVGVQEESSLDIISENMENMAENMAENMEKMSGEFRALSKNEVETLREKIIIERQTVEAAQKELDRLGSQDVQDKERMNEQKEIIDNSNENIQRIESQIQQSGGDQESKGFKSDLFNTIKDGVMAPINAVKDGFNFFKDTLTEGANIAKDTYAFGQKAFGFAKAVYAFDIKAFALKTKAFLLEKKKFMLDKLAILMNPFVLLGTAMLGLIAIFANFGPQIREGILNVITFISDGVKEAVGKLGDFLYDGFVNVMNGLISLINMIPGVNIDLMKTTDELKKEDEKAKLSEGQNLVASAVASGAVGGDLRLGGESVIGGDVGSALIRDVKNQKDMVASRMTQQADLFQQRAADAGMLPPVVVTNVNDNKQMNTQTNAVSVASGPVANNDDTVAKLLGAG